MDFVIAVDRKARSLIEAKRGDEGVSRALVYYQKKLGVVDAVQVVKDLERPLTIDGVQIEDAAEWLSRLAM